MVATARRQLISTVGWLARRPITRRCAGVRGEIGEDGGTEGSNFRERGSRGEEER